jgi:hypothetical protein
LTTQYPVVYNFGVDNIHYQGPPEGVPEYHRAQDEALRAIIREELKKVTGPHPCRFWQISEADAKEIGHAIVVIADLGEGNLSAGLSTIRENHQWMSRQRRRSERVGTALAIFICVSLLGSVITAVGYAARHFILAIMGK